MSVSRDCSGDLRVDGYFVKSTADVLAVEVSNPSGTGQIKGNPPGK